MTVPDGNVVSKSSTIVAWPCNASFRKHSCILPAARYRATCSFGCLSPWRRGWPLWSCCASKCGGRMLNDEFKEFAVLLNSNRLNSNRVEYRIIGSNVRAAYGHPR